MQEYWNLIAKKSVAHFEHTVGHCGKILVVGDNYDCLAESVAQVKEKTVNILFCVAVQVA